MVEPAVVVQKAYACRAKLRERAYKHIRSPFIHPLRRTGQLIIETMASGRLLAESIALAEMHSKGLGYQPVMDPAFAADLEDMIRSRKPRDLSAWD
jgi:hypothetical protein